MCIQKLAILPESWGLLAIPLLFVHPGSFFFFLFGFLRQDFSVALESVLELALVDQAGLKLTETHLPLPPECWD